MRRHIPAAVSLTAGSLPVADTAALPAAKLRQERSSVAAAALAVALPAARFAALHTALCGNRAKR